MTKEKRQTALLVALIIGILGLLVYFNIDRFKPHALGGAMFVPQTARLRITTSEAEELFNRNDYKEMKEHGLVPVRPMGLGNDNPFRPIVDEVMGQ